MGANVTGIDASDKNIKIAKLHSKKNKLKINYLCLSPEKLKIEKITNTLVFASCKLKSRDKIIATASGVWKKTSYKFD